MNKSVLKLKPKVNSIHLILSKNNRNLNELLVKTLEKIDVQAPKNIVSQALKDQNIRKSES